MSCGASPIYPRDPSQYELLGMVGEGSSSVVCRARCIPLDEEVAVKVINLDLSEMSLEQFTLEATLMRQSCHQNVLRMKGSFSCGSGLWLVLQYHPHGSVLDMMNAVFDGGISDEILISAILFQALEGLKYFHSIGAVHRDVKAANLLVARLGQIRLSDFGVSVTQHFSAAALETQSESTASEAEQKAKKKRKKKKTSQKKSKAGSPCWMAPEALSSEGYKQASDIWSLGITALECALGKPPHYKHSPMKVFSLVLRGEPPNMKAISPNKAAQFSPEFHDFVRLCLQKDYRQRPTAEELLLHPLFTSNFAKMALGSSASYIRGKLVELKVPELVTKRTPQHLIPRVPNGRPGPTRMGDQASERTGSSSAHDGVTGDGGDGAASAAGDSAAPGLSSVSDSAAAPDAGTNGGCCDDGWEFPDLTPRETVPVQWPGGGEPWQKELYHKHVAEMSRYKNSGVLMQAGRLTVYTATDKNSNLPVSVHEYEIRSGYHEAVLKNDFVHHLQKISNQFILPCHHVWEDGKRAVYWVTDTKSTGPISQNLETKGAYSATEVQQITSQLLYALKYCHQNNIFMGQVTTHQMFQKATLQLDVSSALVARRVFDKTGDTLPAVPPEGERVPLCVPTMGNESLFWLQPPDGLPPEVLLAPEVCVRMGMPESSNNHDNNASRPPSPTSSVDWEIELNEKTDIYGVGLAVLHMLTARTPYKELSQMRVPDMLREKRSGRDPRDLRSLPFTWQSFVSLCLVSPERRPSAASLLENTVLQGVANTFQEEPPVCIDATCPACLRPPEDSRRLDCGHCICVSCAEKAHAFASRMHSLLRKTSGWAFGEPSRALVCPQCGEATTLGGGGIEELPHGVIKVPVCDHCEEKPAETECEQCMVTMCSNCSAQLHRRGRFRNHVVRPLLATSLTTTEVVDPGEVIDRLGERAEVLSAAQENLLSTAQSGRESIRNARQQIVQWADRARELVTKQEQQLLHKVDTFAKLREETAAEQLQLIDLLKGQIDKVLGSDPVKNGGAVSVVAVRRFNSLLATPCASDPQRWDLNFYGDPSSLTTYFPKIFSLSAPTSQLSWTAPPGKTTDKAARAFITLAAVVVCLLLKKPYVALRVRPEGIPEGGNWRVRQLLVFNPSGSALTLQVGSVSASESMEGNGPENAATGCSGGSGSWAAVPGSTDTSWLEVVTEGLEATTVVVRSYPQRMHAPDRIILEGTTDGHAFVHICSEDVIQSGTACWDCIINF